MSLVVDGVQSGVCDILYRSSRDVNVLEPSTFGLGS